MYGIGVSIDFEKSIKIMIEETNTRFGKMEIFGQVHESSLSVAVAKSAGLKLIEERTWGEESGEKA